MIQENFEVHIDTKHDKEYYTLLYSDTYVTVIRLAPGNI